MVKSCTEDKIKIANKPLPTISQEKTESVAINDKTNIQPSTETPPSTTSAAAPTTAQE